LPLRSDHVVDSYLGQCKILATVALIASDRVDRIQQGSMRCIVRPELKRRQDFWQHAPVIGAIGGANRGVDATILWLTGRSVLLDQCFERLLAGNWEDHFAHNAIRIVDSRFGDAEENARLPAHLPVFLQKLLNDTPFGPNRDAVCDL
jgi:hypothetical protein